MALASLLLLLLFWQQVTDGGPLPAFDDAVNAALAGWRSPGMLRLFGWTANLGSPATAVAHYLSDVLAGFLLGGFWTFFAAASADFDCRAGRPSHAGRSNSPT